MDRTREDVRPAPEAPAGTIPPHQPRDGGPEAGLWLPLRVEKQRRERGCWAAVAHAVAAYYAPDTFWTQEEIVRRVLGGDLDRFSLAAEALEACDVLEERLARPLTLAELGTQLERGRVVAARIAWSYGGGHLVALSGLSEAGTVRVEDPKYGPAECPYAELLSGVYLLFGRWSHTYLTRPPSRPGA